MANIAKIFVIIVTYKGHQWYERCFTSLRNSEYPVQTIVIDNASNDGTVEYIRESFPEIHLIESKENLGFGRANNLGMRYALDQGCDYVFLLNQDTWIEPNSISELVKIHHHYPEYGVLSPMHVTADMKGLYIEIEDGKTDHANSLLSDCYFQSLKDVYTFKYINAAAWLMTRKTLETIGGFDPIFFLYGEDDNYLQRMEYHGVKLGLAPKIQIIHDHQKKMENMTREYRLYRAEQSKLVEYTNVLKSFSTKSFLWYLYRKLIISLFLCDRSRTKQIKKEITFFKKYRRSIQLSRMINKKQGSSWLKNGYYNLS